MYEKYKKNTRIKASETRILLLANGLFFVLSTFASNFLSTMSLNIQPAERIKIAPKRKYIIISISNLYPLIRLAPNTPNKHGIYRRIQPVGLLSLVIST